MPAWLPSFQSRRTLGYAVGLMAGVVGVTLLLSRHFEDWHSPGPANSGHEQLHCGDCHRPSDGDARQQIQANLKHFLGLRQTGAYFQFKPVTNRDCLECHERPDDRHPVQRFNEPRFAEARKKLHPETCVACHSEHQGVRVTRQDTGFCQVCHQEFSLKHDSISIPHQTLVKQERWLTCLGCHDFHGNHKIAVPTDVGKAIGSALIADYFKGAKSPYAGDIIHKAKEKLDEN